MNMIQPLQHKNFYALRDRNGFIELQRGYLRVNEAVKILNSIIFNCDDVKIKEQLKREIYITEIEPKNCNGWEISGRFYFLN